MRVPALETLFPEKTGEEKENEENVGAAAAVSGYQKQISIKSPKNGYLQYIDGDGLIEIITRHDALLELYYRSGEHLVKGVEIGLLFSNGKWKKMNLKRFLTNL